MKKIYSVPFLTTLYKYEAMAESFSFQNLKTGAVEIV
jgi:hypothetical protein